MFTLHSLYEFHFLDSTHLNSFWVEWKTAQLLFAFNTSLDQQINMDKYTSFTSTTNAQLQSGMAICPNSHLYAKIAVVSMHFDTKKDIAY